MSKVMTDLHPLKLRYSGGLAREVRVVITRGKQVFVILITRGKEGFL